MQGLVDEAGKLIVDRVATTGTAWLALSRTFSRWLRIPWALCPALGGMSVRGSFLSMALIALRIGVEIFFKASLSGSAMRNGWSGSMPLKASAF